MMILSATDGTSNGMMMLLLVLAATVIMIVLLRRHQFRSTSNRDVARDHIARIRDQHKLRNSMDELLVELEEVSRRVGAEVDTRFAKLETVIRDADERIARLEKLLGQRSTRPPTTTPNPPPNPTPNPSPKRQRGIPTTPPSRSPERQQRTIGPVTTQTDDPRFARLYELIDGGATPVKAAEELGMPLGEVELILNLRKFR